MSELRLGFPGNEKKVDAPDVKDSPAPWDLGSDLAVVGKDHPRLDGALKVTGRAKYSYDIRFPGMIYAKMLRSPHASAIVRKLDLSKAKALAGVVYSEGAAGARIRHAGQEVCGLAAESEEILDDALALVEVEYEVLDHAATLDMAMAEGAAKVLDDGPNVRGGRAPGNLDAVAKAHAEADVVVEQEYRTQVQTHSCLETHGCVCKWEGGKLTVWASTQATFAIQSSMAQALRMPAADILVITEHMGGGFGSKFGISSWDAFCARAARETKRPCRLMLDRREEHLVAGNRPDSIQRCKFSAKRDGTLCGASVEAFGTAGNGGGAGVFNPGIYAFKAAALTQSDVLTHAGGARAFRAPSHPQGVFALEGMMDELADALGMDPLAFRKKNDRHPVRLAQYDVGAKEIGWERRVKSGSAKGPVKRGLGMASTRWGHNARPGDAVNCRIGRDGSVLFSNGSQDIGTGTRTVIAVIGAEELGLPVARVSVRLGHTSDPYGHGSGGSVTAPSIAPVVRHAAWLAKRELLAAVAAAAGGDAGTMDLRGGRVVGGSRDLTFEQACAMMPKEAIEAQGQGRAEFFGLPRFSGEVAGVQFAEVDVDTETGAVRVVKIVAVQDCGLVVDPLLARSQISGGVIQGISYALFEERILDRATGNMVNPNLLDYKVLGAADMPEIVSIAFSVANGISPTGVSSLGEPPTVPTAGAIGNAVANAIGARVRSLPITPDKVLAALGVLS